MQLYNIYFILLKQKKSFNAWNFPIETVFTASSEDEVVSWALAFGRDAVVMEPAAVRERIIIELSDAAGNYRCAAHKSPSDTPCQ